MKKNYAIILASGMGLRSGLITPKQFYKIGGKTILEHSVDIFENHDRIHAIIIITHPYWVDKTADLLSKSYYQKVCKIIPGGQTRQESSYIGVHSIPEEDSNVLIHDSVRPFLQSYIITVLLNNLQYYGAVNTVIPTTDSLVEINHHSEIISVPNRNYYRRGQTPQAFNLSVIKEAHERAREQSDMDNTDDCSLVLKYTSSPVKFVEGNDFNIKITSPVDLAIADKIFQLRSIQQIDFNPDDLKDKIIVIFGASQGIGLSIINMAKKYGAHTYGFSRSNGVDICDADSLKNALDGVINQEGRIDIIISTVGVLNIGLLVQRNIDDIRAEIEVNYLSAIRISQLAYPILKRPQKRDGGALLFFTSSSYTKGRAKYSIYSSMKSALVNLTQALANEWENEKIRVNIINPSRTMTRMREEAFGKEDPSTLLHPDIVAQQALATVLSTHITGQIIDVRKD